MSRKRKKYRDIDNYLRIGGNGVEEYKFIYYPDIDYYAKSREKIEFKEVVKAGIKEAAKII